MCSSVMGTYALGIVGLLYYYRVWKYSSLRSNMQDEIQRRLGRESPLCMEALLGGALKHYKTPVEDVERVMEKAKRQVEMERQELENNTASRVEGQGRQP